LSFPLYLDEDVNRYLAKLLLARGYDVVATADAGRANQGLSDESQLEFASAIDRAILNTQRR
jgi:hypothetical protein